MQKNTIMDNEIYKIFKDFFRFDKLQDIFLQIFEILLGLFAGGLIGALITTESPSDWLIYGTIVSIILTIIFTIIRLLKISHFPNTAIDFLKSKKDIENLSKELERKKTIDEYIDLAIQTLNLNTCPLTNEEDFHFCENPLEKGLKDVLNSIINQPHYILNCNKSKYTIAIHLPWFPQKKAIKGENGKFEIIEIQKTLVFRDDFKLLGFLTDDILIDLDAEGLKYQIHIAGRETFNHNYLKVASLKNGKNEYNLITSPIPAVCESGITGVLYIFSENCIIIPNDISNILLIFGRILSNWMSKYEACLKSRLNK
jgi:hypothetical protein